MARRMILHDGTPGPPRTGGRRGLTLMEILICVAIVSILALLAVPSLLLARTRSMVARSMNDRRVLAAALEAYHSDRGAYPPSREFYGPVLSTPVAYLAGDAGLRDPFGPDPADDYPYYRYQRITTEAPESLSAAYVRRAEARYGKYRLTGMGPARRTEVEIVETTPVRVAFPLPYDPTNGIASVGLLIRSHRTP